MTAHCVECGEAYNPRRRDLGYRTCLDCGQEAALAARASWCIAPVAHKQGATLVTDKSALKQINKYSAE